MISENEIRLSLLVFFLPKYNYFYQKSGSISFIILFSVPTPSIFRTSFEFVPQKIRLASKKNAQICNFMNNNVSVQYRYCILQRSVCYVHSTCKLESIVTGKKVEFWRRKTHKNGGINMNQQGNRHICYFAKKNRLLIIWNYLHS